MHQSRHPDYRLLAASLLTLFVILSACIPAQQPDPESSQPDACLRQPDEPRGRIAQALYRLQRCAQITGWTPDLHRQAGDLYQLSGDMDRALAHWQVAVQRSNDVTLLQRVASALRQAEKRADALALIQRILLLEPDNAWAHYQAGLMQAAFNPLAAEPHLRRLVDDESYGALARDLLGAVTRYHDDPSVSSRAAAVLAAHEHWSDAEVAFEQAAALNYPFPLAMAHVGWMRDLQGKSGDAWIAQAVALGPDDAAVRQIQGLHLRYQGDLTGSLAALEIAIALDPQNPVHYAELGTTYREIGDLETAQRLLERAVSLSGNAPALEAALNRFYAEEAYWLPEEVLSRLLQETPSAP